MENYTLDILFNENSLDINELDIETLVIFNKKISDKIKQNTNINYKNKLLKLEKLIIEFPKNKLAYKAKKKLNSLDCINAIQ